jgi:hypothetical protein
MLPGYEAQFLGACDGWDMAGRVNPSKAACSALNSIATAG